MDKTRQIHFTSLHGSYQLTLSVNREVNSSTGSGKGGYCLFSSNKAYLEDIYRMLKFFFYMNFMKPQMVDSVSALASKIQDDLKQ